MIQTKPGQFRAFMKILMKDAPTGYSPWIFPVQKANKAPSTKISWKAEQSRLTIPEAVRRLKQNYGNIGIAGKPDDQLILLDIDEPNIIDEVKDTLQIRSRSRGTKEKPAIHAIYWADPEDDKLPCNIPTDKGELRSSDQYVVAPGSYVPCTEEELENKVQDGKLNKEEKKEILEDPFRGYYTLANEKDIAKIKFEELPEIFRETYTDSKNQDQYKKEDYNHEQVKGSGKHSALFDLEITDLTGRGLKERDPHPLHISGTKKNWSISSGVGHCWRHLVSLNALQFLCVESGYLTCVEAGSPHHNSNAGPSVVRGDNQAIWEAWLHAKKSGYIPKDDPIPTRALKYIAEKHGVYQENEEGLLTDVSYNKTLEILEGEY